MFYCMTLKKISENIIAQAGMVVKQVVRNVMRKIEHKSELKLKISITAITTY